MIPTPDPPPSTRQQLLSVAEAAEKLAVSKLTAYRLIHRGELPALKVGGQFRIDRDELHTYVYREEKA